MFKSRAVGRRLLKVEGGSLEPVYLLLQGVAGGEDLDRGIAGTPQDFEPIELKPRPTVEPVPGPTITRAASVLRLGDYQLDIAGSQVTEAQLKDVSARIQNGTDIFTIVTFQPFFIEGIISYYTAFIRGVRS